jgi:hypothetical protein
MYRAKHYTPLLSLLPPEVDDIMMPLDVKVDALVPGCSELHSKPPTPRALRNRPPHELRLCEICPSQHAAVLSCHECSQLMCHEASLFHSRFPATRQHLLVQILPFTGPAHALPHSPRTPAPVDFALAFLEAFRLPNGSRKWRQLAELSHTFLTQAQRHGALIITEWGLPQRSKTIKMQTIGGLAGGEKFLHHGLLWQFWSLFASPCFCSRITKRHVCHYVFVRYFVQAHDGSGPVSVVGGAQILVRRSKV